jgi:hypothetical protein
MIKSLRWAYNRGVKQERLRIKRLVAEFEREASQRFREYQIPNASGQKSSPNKFEMEVDKQVHNILQNLVSPPEYGRVIEKLEPAPIDEEPIE